MCSPLGDGAAAVLVCSEDALADFAPSVRARAVRVLASELSGGKYRKLDEPGLSRIAADRAYARAGVAPQDIDVVELHDATSFCEIYQLEMLRLCPEGQGGRFVESGATALGGRLPVNLSGGLVSKGHPIGPVDDPRGLPAAARRGRRAASPQCAPGPDRKRWRRDGL
jgi:acetyl-CoA acetyltransferase